MTDAELLRAHEPILRFTHGELFLPADAERYIAECDLWMGRSQRESRLVAEVGTLTPERLASLEPEPGKRFSLRLVQRPLTGVELARWWRRADRPAFRAAGRLARVGLFARVVDAAFNVSLLVRGTVPGGTAAAAWEKYRTAVAGETRPVYYGRVLRRDGWIVLQYLFFYFMNDWRSTFGGANDHEADWEQVFVYLEDADDGPRPVWVAAAAHDEVGDDLRRRWDDPELEREGTHPIFYPGAGSHATYFTAGEYITAAPLPGLGRLHGLLDGFRSFWRDTLRQADPGDLSARLQGWFSIPFIDYARGDGVGIGPGQQLGWAQHPIGDDVGWVHRYRGLFGLDTYDRFAGERAPAGPKYTRDAEVRRSWHDPVGFAGLTKVPPPGLVPGLLKARIGELADALVEMQAKEQRLAGELPGVFLEAEALREAGAPPRLLRETETRILRAEAELTELRSSMAATGQRIEATTAELDEAGNGLIGDPRHHLRHHREPVPPATARYGAVVELWSAIGFGLLLMAVIGLLVFTDVRVWAAVLLSVAIYVVVEAAFRRRMLKLLLRVTLVLAFVGALILAWEFAGPLLIAAVLGLAVLTITDNVRELRRG
jgi:hypothetical protein